MATVNEILTTAESDPTPAGAVWRAARAAESNEHTARHLGDDAIAALVAERSGEPDGAFVALLLELLTTHRTRSEGGLMSDSLTSRLRTEFEAYLIANRPAG